MKETILPTDSPQADKPEARLPNPHFDDKTVATAQPVEPLPNVSASTRTRLSGSLRRYLSLTAILVSAVALVTVVTFAVVLASVHQRLNVEEPEAAITPLAQPVQTDSSTELSERNAVQRSKPRKSRFNFSQSRPVPRKVGVIYY